MKDVNNISTKKQVGRRIGDSDTRAHILKVAQTLFAEKGVDQTTVRQIATEADVNPALVIHYFKSKQQLFIESVQPLLQAHQLATLSTALQGSRDEFGLRLAKAIVDMMSDETRRNLILSVIRTAVSGEGATAILRNTVQNVVLDEIEKHIPAPDSRLKATLIGSQFIGLVMARYIVKIEPIASASPNEIIKYLAPRLQAYFDLPAELT